MTSLTDIGGDAIQTNSLLNIRLTVKNFEEKELDISQT